MKKTKTKETKTIDVILNGFFEESFILELEKDENSAAEAVLTAPYVNWLDNNEPAVDYRVYRISGDLLTCIEKNYFDKNVIAIPVRGYPYDVEMEDIIHKVIPEKIYNQMLAGTFKIRKAK